MTIDLIVPLNEHGDTLPNSVPYCDDDMGWFYRSFSRASYRVTIKSVTVLLDVDKEFEDANGTH